MLKRTIEPDGTKGIVVVKEDGRVYKVLAGYKKERDSDESLKLLVMDLMNGRNNRIISDDTYNVGDDRRLQVKSIYDFVISDMKLLKSIGNTIEDYIEHYDYRLKEIRCIECNCNLGYVEGDYSIVCDSCGSLNRR